MSSKTLRQILPLLLLVGGVLIGGNRVGFAQSTNSGDVRGIATDSTGAAIPGVTVTAVDTDKNVTTVYTTDATGLYDTGPIVADHYLFTFKKDGFKTYVRGPVTVEVGLMTINAQLAVGATNQQVVVTTELPLLNTESGAVEDTLEAKTMADLPQPPGDPDWEQFVILQPGAENMMGQEGGDTGQSSAVNGNMPYDNVMTDGATSTLPQSQNSFVSIFETVDEVKISNSAFSAQYGTGNIIYNQISKGGTSQFHGAGYDYLQNKAFNAASYGFGSQVTVPTIHFNDFGFAVGGPVIPLKKLFFYFDFDQTISNGGANNGFITVPTAAEQSGDFTAAGLPTLYDPTHQTLVTSGNCTYQNAAYVTSTDPSGIITAPAPCVERPSFISEYGSNKIPSSMINPAAKLINSYFPNPNSTGTPGKYGVTANNYAYSAPNQNPIRRYFGRMDWDSAQNNRLTLSESEGTNVSNNLAQGFCPINCQHGDEVYHNAQVSDVWTLSPSLVNEARMGFTYGMSAYTSYGNGNGWASKLQMPMLVADIFPTLNLNNFYSLGAASNSIYKEMAFDPSDVVMMVKGRHVLHFGGEFLINRADSTNWGYVNPGTLGFNGDYTAAGGAATSTYDGLDYADFLLGQTNNWSASDTPEYGGRWKAPQLFVQDDWKARPNLTINLGVRWMGETGWRDVHGNETVWDPAVTSMDVIDPVGAGYGQLVQGGMWYEFLGQNGRQTLQRPKYDIVLPRFGFSWGIRNNTVLKGGFGVYASTWSEDRYGAGLGSAFGGSGGQADVTTGNCPVVQTDSNGDAPDTVDPGCGVGAFNGTSIMSTYVQAPTTPWAHEGLGSSVNYNQYDTPVPTNYQWNLGVQRQFAGDYAAEVDYVGNHGENLTYDVDINQVPESDLGPTDQQYEPYPLYKDITGSTNNAVSNFNALEAMLTKRMSYGLSFNANYTWSHFLDDMDSSGWGGQNGNMDYQNAYSPASNYSRSNWDMRHMLKGQAVYKLPFGTGGLFLNHSTLADEAVGGWQASATWVAQTGNPMEVVSANQGSANAQGGTVFLNRIGNFNTNDPVTGNHYHSLAEWYNESAFSAPGQYTFGNFVRNQISGPGLTDINFSLGKTFDLWPERGVRFQIRADAYNVLNHPSWGFPGNNQIGVPLVSPGGNLPPASNIAITSTTVGGRSMQFYGRLSF